MNHKSCVTNLFKIFSGILSMAVIIGCATVTTNTNQRVGLWQKQATLPPLTTWHITGKIGFQHQQQGGSANIDWQQQSTHFTLELSSPFSAEKLAITGNQQQVQLISSTGIKHDPQSPEALLQQHFGCVIPITSLKYWAQGRPVPNLPVEEIQLSNGNELVKLVQQGWTINYYAYKIFKSRLLPTKITLQHKTIKLKLLFKNWFKI